MEKLLPRRLSQSYWNQLLQLSLRLEVPCLTMPIEASIMDKCQARTTPGKSVRRDASHGCICIRQKASGGVPEACQGSSLALAASSCVVCWRPLPACCSSSSALEKDGVQGSASRVATKWASVDSWDGGKGSWLVVGGQVTMAADGTILMNQSRHARAPGQARQQAGQARRIVRFALPLLRPHNLLILVHSMTLICDGQPSERT